MIVIFNKNQEFDASWCDEVVNVMRPNILGNPYPLTRSNSRETVIDLYRKWLTERMQEDSKQKQEVIRLAMLHGQGKKIGLLCCCSPMPCHADVIKQFIGIDHSLQPFITRPGLKP